MIGHFGEVWQSFSLTHEIVVADHDDITLAVRCNGGVIENPIVILFHLAANIFQKEGQVFMHEKNKAWIKLPVNLTPPLKCYLTQALPLSIILAENDQYFPFLYNYFYFFISRTNIENLFRLSNSNDWFFYNSGIFEINIINLPVQVIKPDTIINIMEKMFLHGYYPVGDFNEKYIPAFSSYGQRDFIHPFLVNGCNRSKCSISILGYHRDGKYREISININDFYNAVTNCKKNPNMFLMYFFRINKKFKGNHFDYKRFLRKIDDYINSDEACDYGIGANIKLVEYIKSCRDYVDIRYVYVFYEHKYFMLERLKYLKSISLLKNEQIIKEFEILVKICETLKPLALKYNITRQATIVDRMLEIINSINEEEMLLFRTLLAFQIGG